ncbi:antibiotic biosynthesis monooxygenase [Solwaraspora sp. WMMD406]|uniref:antibiotic biosynthesis monooxygenase family protein n=1 Tax=Solwaraspora sp. WMMD406 TaxID=3016095 RepID=UPI002417817D|nr:antibiotic biosynthesis monooxygenase family protein [Solwaraspora sp. WMMD406]MDG4763517.1 antibiotic biosynthesis monooxygenase [Solwaraspora sp. WMMD406]
MKETAATVASDHLRVMFFLTVEAEAQARFLAAYDRICADVADVPGHLMDQVCQSVDDPREWVITSEWRSAEDFAAWESGEGHRELAMPLVAETTNRRSVRFLVRRETRQKAETR